MKLMIILSPLQIFDYFTFLPGIGRENIQGCFYELILKTYLSNLD